MRGRAWSQAGQSSRSSVGPSARACEARSAAQCASARQQHCTVGASPAGAAKGDSAWRLMSSAQRCVSCAHALTHCGRQASPPNRACTLQLTDICSAASAGPSASSAVSRMHSGRQASRLSRQCTMHFASGMQSWTSCRRQKYCQASSAVQQLSSHHQALQVC